MDNPNQKPSKCGHQFCPAGFCRFDPASSKDSPAESADPLAESEANGLHPLFGDLFKNMGLMDNEAAKAVFGVKEKP